MPDTQIFRGATESGTSTFTLPDDADYLLKCVNASLDGSGAVGDFLPCVTLVSDSGHVIARAVDQDVKVAAGGSAEVSWFPRVRRKTTAKVDECVLLGSGNGTDTLTITLDKTVPHDGVLHVVWCQATIGDALDTFSQPDNTFDSQGVPGWVFGAPSGAVVGKIRETITGSGPATTSQAGSVARACTTADLGVGDTITVHYSTADPLLFHTAGLVIWQRGFMEAIRQFGAFMYGNGSDHPGTNAPLARLSWDEDFGPGSVTADRDALMLTAMGAYPAVAGFSPYLGTKIGEIATGSVSIAAACFDVLVGTFPDPGGTWPSDAIQLVGNYQMVYPRTYSL